MQEEINTRITKQDFVERGWCVRPFVFCRGEMLVLLKLDEMSDHDEKERRCFGEKCGTQAGSLSGKLDGHSCFVFFILSVVQVPLRPC